MKKSRSTIFPSRLLVSFVFLLLTFGRPAISGEILVNLDAAKLPPGKLERWPNAGSLGGDFSFVKNLPVVSAVSGRPCVTFTGKADFLKATFQAPDAIVDGRPFTFSAWVFDPALDTKKVICSWAAFPFDSAEVGIGRGRNAAFYNSPMNKVGFEGGVPASAEWHQLTVTFDGTSVRVYLDGDLNSEKKAGALKVKGGGGVYLGAGWDSRKDAAVLPFAGSLAQVRLCDSALSPVEVWNLAGRFTAFGPGPKSGQTIEELRTTLHWGKGDSAAGSFNLYLGADSSEVEKAGPGSTAFKGNLPASVSSFGPIDLALGRTYFWRVDELDPQGGVRWPGKIWSFSVDAGAARNPFPGDKTGGTKIKEAELRWKPGRYAVSQDVYFSDSERGAGEATAPQLKGLAPDAESCPVPKALEYGKTYFWRIATDNGRLPAAPGDVWSFRVEDEPIPDDITFFLGSDLHYGASVSVARADEATIDLMNALPGTPCPKDFGGFVRTPRGVVLLGDLVDDGNGLDAGEVWASFWRDFGVSGDARLAYPVYEGVGNHDGDPDRPVRLGVKARNRLRAGLTAISPDGLHYSWDWENVHFVHLNLFPGSAGDDIVNAWGERFQGDWKLPQHSLEFLIDDLAKNVGSSGRPVVLFQHYGFDEWSRSWYSESERTAYYEAIKSYNVIGIFWGHSHAPQFIPWNGIPTFCVGSTQKDPAPGEAFVVHITPKEMTIAERTKDAWGLTRKISLKAK